MAWRLFDEVTFGGRLMTPRQNMNSPRSRRIFAIAAAVLLVGAVLLSLWMIDVLAFIAGLCAVAVLGLLLTVPAARRGAKQALSADGQFAAARDGHELCGYSIAYTNLGNAARQTRGRLSALLTDAGWLPDTLHIVLWVLRRDGSHTWTVVRQEMSEASRWTATVDGPMSDEDMTLDGMIDPYAAAARLAKTQIDLPISNIQFLSWGVERDTSRAVLVGWAETDVPASDLRAHEYADPTWTAYLADLYAEGSAKTIGWAGSAQWRAGALYGLARMVEEAGGLRKLERHLEPRWANTIGHNR